jgi:GT2 family glycosyltransferase
MRGAVVVVSYNTCEYLRRCLQSVFASTAKSGERAETAVIVIDNDSRDGSVEMTAREFPQVHLASSATNLGFTGGNNLALALLGFDVTLTPDAAEVLRGLGDGMHSLNRFDPDWVLLLNSDAELQGDALAKMAACLQTHAEVGVCGAHLHNRDGSFQHGAFRFPSLAQVALDLFPLENLPGYARLYNSRWNGRYPIRAWQGPEPFAVDFVLGAAMMARSEAIRQVGGLDDAFFMYCEEIDWCLCMRAAGWEVSAVTDAHVVHHGGQSTSQVRWTAYERLWRSRMHFYHKHRRYFGPGHLAAVRLLLHAGMWARTRRGWRRFAQGAITGEQAAEELEVYARIARL